MADYKPLKMVNAAGDERTAVSPTQEVQYEYHGYRAGGKPKPAEIALDVPPAPSK